MSSSPRALAPEWSAWIRLLDLIGSHLIAPNANLPGSVFLASSAGGVYEGNVYPVVTESTPARPVSHYGVHKLGMEEALLKWAERFPNVSALIGRISSLYGPGQDLHKAQGIISHLSRCLIYRRPLNIHAPLDMRRDYLFADDCAHQVATSGRRLVAERPRTIIKIFASEEPTCVAQILGIFFRMARHRPLITARQPPGAWLTSLNFRSMVWRNLDGMRKTDLATGIHLVHKYQLGLFRHGLLPPPAPSGRNAP